MTFYFQGVKSSEAFIFCKIYYTLTYISKTTVSLPTSFHAQIDNQHRKLVGKATFKKRLMSRFLAIGNRT